MREEAKRGINSHELFLYYTDYKGDSYYEIEEVTIFETIGEKTRYDEEK